MFNVSTKQASTAEKQISYIDNIGSSGKPSMRGSTSGQVQLGGMQIKIGNGPHPSIFSTGPTSATNNYVQKRYNGGKKGAKERIASAANPYHQGSFAGNALIQTKTPKNLDINFKEKIFKPKQRLNGNSFAPGQVSINSMLLKTKPTSTNSKLKSSAITVNDGTTLDFNSNTVSVQNENKIYLARISG